MLGPQTRHLRSTVRIERGQRIAEPVAQGGIVNTDACARAIEQRVVPEAPVVHAAAGAQTTEAQHIAVPQRIQHLQRAADTGSSCIAVAEIIERDRSLLGAVRPRIRRCCQTRVLRLLHR